jgi:hypothetical protein
LQSWLDPGPAIFLKQLKRRSSEFSSRVGLVYAL